MHRYRTNLVKYSHKVFVLHYFPPLGDPITNSMVHVVIPSGAFEQTSWDRIESDQGTFSAINSRFISPLIPVEAKTEELFCRKVNQRRSLFSSQTSWKTTDSSKVKIWHLFLTLVNNWTAIHRKRRHKMLFTQTGLLKMKVFPLWWWSDQCV